MACLDKSKIDYNFQSYSVPEQKFMGFCVFIEHNSYKEIEYDSLNNTIVENISCIGAGDVIKVYCYNDDFVIQTKEACCFPQKVFNQEVILEIYNEKIYNENLNKFDYRKLFGKKWVCITQNSAGIFRCYGITNGLEIDEHFNTSKVRIICMKSYNEFQLAPVVSQKCIDKLRHSIKINLGTTDYAKEILELKNKINNLEDKLKQLEKNKTVVTIAPNMNSGWVVDEKYL